MEARPRASASRRSRVSPAHPAAVVLAVAIGLWILTFGILVWRRQAYFGTIDFDLGIHDQSIWLLSRGHWFTTVRGLPIFGHHATFGYFLLVPFYWLGAGPQFINLLQITVLALGAIPIYLLARDRLVSPWACADPRARVVAAAVGAVVRVGDLPSGGHRDRAGALRLSGRRAQQDRLVLDLARPRDRMEGRSRAALHRARAALPHSPTLAPGRGDDRRRHSLVRGLRHGHGAAPRRWSDRLRAALRRPRRFAVGGRTNRGDRSRSRREPTQAERLGQLRRRAHGAHGVHAAGRAWPLAVGSAAGDRQPALDRELHMGRAVPLRRVARRRARPRDGRRDRRDRSLVPAATTTIAARAGSCSA